MFVTADESLLIENVSHYLCQFMRFLSTNCDDLMRKYSPDTVVVNIFSVSISNTFLFAIHVRNPLNRIAVQCLLFRSMANALLGGLINIDLMTIYGHISHRLKFFFSIWSMDRCDGTSELFCLKPIFISRFIELSINWREFLFAYFCLALNFFFHQHTTFSFRSQTTISTI